MMFIGDVRPETLEMNVPQNALPTTTGEKEKQGRPGPLSWSAKYTLEEQKAVQR